MGHLHSSKEDVYRAFAERLNRNPVGAPFSPTLIKILQHLYNPHEAEVGSKFPILPATFEQLVESTSIEEKELKNHLDEMSKRGLVIEYRQGENLFYLLTPMVVGFFEYTFMRTSERLPLLELSKLFDTYLHEPGVAEEIFGSHTKMFQSWAYEKYIPLEVETEVLNYEKASLMIRDAKGGGLSMCSCRHKAMHLGKNCDAPMDVCTSLGLAAKWLIERDLATPATTDDLLRVLEQTEELGLVHLGDNVQKRPAYICHCCGCCCGVLRSITEKGVNSIQPSNFRPRFNYEKCNGCARCESRCHIGAIEMIEQTPGDKKSNRPVLKEDICIGCGACLGDCRKEAMFLERIPVPIEPPRHKIEQIQRIAIERGRY